MGFYMKTTYILEAYFLGISHTKTQRDHIRIISEFINFVGDNGINLNEINETAIQNYLESQGNNLSTKEKRLLYIKKFFLYLNYRQINSLDISKITLGDFEFKNIDIPISKSHLIELMEKGYSNTDISNKYNISLQYLKQIKRYYNLNSKRLTQKEKDDIVLNILKDKGINVLIKYDTYSRYLLNNKIRACVIFSSRLTKHNYFTFNLSRRINDYKNIDFEIYNYLKSDLVILNYKKLSDIVILIGIKDYKKYIWIVPSTQKILEHKDVQLSILDNSIHSNWKDNWGLLNLF
jgi:hypothetical protein